MEVGFQQTICFSTWTTDNSQEDAFISNGLAVITTDTDIITTTPIFENGSYNISFDLGIYPGGAGYFSIGNSNDPNNWQWEVEVIFGEDGLGYTTQSYETWSYNTGGNIAIEIAVDLDSQVASILVDGACVETWDWSGNLGGLNFWGGGSNMTSQLITLVYVLMMYQCAYLDVLTLVHLTMIQKQIQTMDHVKK